MLATIPQPVPPITSHNAQKQHRELPNNAENHRTENGPKHGKEKSTRLQGKITVDTGVLEDFILEALAFKSMHNREEEVTKAHGDTLEWIFSNKEQSAGKSASAAAGLASFLGTNELGPIYWVTGKPGSGKSTFVRFLFQHPTVDTWLQQWGDSLPVSKAGFFFWTSGSKEQRSETGLLRYLLHQLLSENTDLIPFAFAETWEKLGAMTTKERIKFKLTWGAEELRQAFQSLVAAALPSRKICLFIDGLDEFDGDHSAIIRLFRDLGHLQGGTAVKICLSSRPWAVFERAFQLSVPHLRLQDLTHNDMVDYATNRLREPKEVGELLRTSPSASDLIETIVSSADGVFLWVRVALDNVLDNIPRENVSISQIRAMVQSLPRDLDRLFEKLLFNDKTDADIVETAVLFRLLTAREVVADFVRDDSAHSLTVWEVAFATARADDDLALALQVERPDDEMLRLRCSSTVTHVRQCFAGLLALHGENIRGEMNEGELSTAYVKPRWLARARLTYIHRTVRDWLMEGQGVRERMMQNSPPDFDPHLRLLRSYILGMKRPLGIIEHHRWLDDMWPGIALAMTHARYVQVDAPRLLRSYVNEVESTISWYWRTKPNDPYDHWARAAFGSYEVRMKAPPIWQPFLCLAVKFGLKQYVEQELAARTHPGTTKTSKPPPEAPQDPKATPLLAYATEFLCSRQKTIFPLSDPAMVSLLLRNPSSINPGPNHEYVTHTTRATMTPWLALLRHLRDARRRGWVKYYDIDPDGTMRWAEIVRHFIEIGGADVAAVVQEDKWDPEISAVGVVDMLVKTYGSKEMVTLKQLMLRWLE
jgi:hypothetical protein